MKVKPKRLRDYWQLLTEKDTYWFAFFYTITFGGFAGLAASLVLYFKSTYGLTKVQAGDWAALCMFAGVMARPLGGALADRFGGIRTLTICYTMPGKDRPKGFESAPGSAATLVVWKRGKR